MKEFVKGLNIHEQEIEIKVDDLYFRPSSYGLIIDDGKIALLRSTVNNKYIFPGGGVDLGETMEEAMKREVVEETGLVVETADFIDAADAFFEYTPDNLKFHAIQFFYLCTVSNNSLITTDQIVDDNAVKQPQWVDISGLKIEDFSKHEGDLIERLLNKIQNPSVSQ